MFKRLKELALQIWPLLTEEEQDAFAYDCGLTQYIEYICKIAHIDAYEIDCDDFGRLLNELCTL